jgi:hypothetical protein
MKPGELYLGQFPFGDTPGMKLRPVLVLSATRLDDAKARLRSRLGM